MKFTDIPRFTEPAHYYINISWDFIEEALVRYIKVYDLQIDPDFQREHVWIQDQQERYVEFMLMGGSGAEKIQFNCNGWQGNWKGPMVLVDGKQRLNAIRLFLDNKLKVFGHTLLEFEDWKRAIRDIDLIFHINNLKTKAQVIQWYLDLNFGGTPHTKEERARVQKLLELEKKNG